MSDAIEKRNENNNTALSKFQYFPDNNHKPAEESLNPRQIVGLIFRYKWLLLFFLIAGFAGAWYYADNVDPTYQSTGTLLISSSKADANNELSRIISQTTGVGTNSTLVNELQILRSREFSRQVAEKLMEEDPGDINTFPSLWIREENGETYKAPLEKVTARIRSGMVFRQTEEESDVVEIIFTGPSPEEVTKVVNEAMEIYVENSTRQNRQAAESTANFLEEEQNDIKQKLEASEQNLRNYMDRTGIVQVNEQANGMINQRTETEAELQRITLELGTVEEAIENNERQLERIKPGLSEQFSEAIGPKIRNSQEEMARYEAERTLIISKNPGVLERDPLPSRLVYLDEQIKRLKEDIQELSDQLFTEDDEFMGMDTEDRAQLVSAIQSRLVELQIEQNQLQSRRDALMEHKQQMDQEFNSLPEGMVELAKLQRDVAINEELYMNISRQYADMSVWKQSQFGFGRIIDFGLEPNSPVSPNKKILLLLGMMLGGLLAASIIFIKEFMDNSVNSVNHLRTNYMPMLTSIPKFEKISKRKRKSFAVGSGKIPQEIVLLQDGTTLASESIRRLKNNVIYQNGDYPPKTIAITSPEKGDGKSTIAANLGIAFAEDGYKTLLIDADFRRPKMHTYFGLSPKEGLTDYLYGKMPFQKLIQSSDLNMLKIVTAGTKNDRPEIIGSSQAFKNFLEKMKADFDVIIIDTPPFGIISDSAAILKRTDAALVVAKYRKTNRGMLLRTIEELGSIQANIVGIVLNDFDPKKETSSYYGSGYYETLYTNYESYS